MSDTSALHIATLTVQVHDPFTAPGGPDGCRHFHFPAWRGRLADATLATEMTDWNLQHAGQRLRGIRNAAWPLPLITDDWSLITDDWSLITDD
jgi:hypothetical protein